MKLYTYLCVQYIPIVQPADRLNHKIRHSASATVLRTNIYARNHRLVNCRRFLPLHDSLLLINNNAHTTLSRRTKTTQPEAILPAPSLAIRVVFAHLIAYNTVYFSTAPSDLTRPKKRTCGYTVHRVDLRVNAAGK